MNSAEQYNLHITGRRASCTWPLTMVCWDWLLLTIWSQFGHSLCQRSVGLGPRHPPLSHNGQTHAFNSTTVPKLTPKSQSVQDRGCAMTSKHQSLLKWKSWIKGRGRTAQSYFMHLFKTILNYVTYCSLPKKLSMLGKGQTSAFNVVVVVVVVVSWGWTISEGREGIVIHSVDLWTFLCSA